MFYSEEDVKGLRMEDLPVWLWSVLVTEDSFVKIPPNFTWPDEEDEPANGGKAAVAAPSGEPERETPLFRYAKVETQYCVDSGLGFCGSLAAVYSRILEDRGEKVFLRGDVFLAKIAKAVLEQDGELFAEACEEHKDEAYFRECAVVLEKWGSIVEEGEAVDRKSWLSLYERVSLLTEEYLDTKLDNGLPAVEVSVCSGNSGTASLELITVPRSTGEEDLNGASMSALGSLSDSSDSIVFDDLENSFYKFLRDNFPFRDDRNGFKDFFRKIYDDDVCGNSDLDWLYGEFFNGSALGADLRPEKIEAGLMKAGVFGAYKDKRIYISQRLVLDSIGNQEYSFLLLLTLLHEYGHFLDDVLHDRAGRSGGDSEGEEGMIFASRFMEYSSADLFNENGGNSRFKFASLTSIDCKGREKQFSLEISDLSYENRKGVLAFSEFGKDSETGDLELSRDGTVIRNVEFSEQHVVNYLNATHHKLTEEAAGEFSESFMDELKNGSMWPDLPSGVPLENGSKSKLIDVIMKEEKGIVVPGLMYRSHFGINQYWHSMYPQSKKIEELESIATSGDINRIMRLEGEIKDEIIISVDLLRNSPGDAGYLWDKIEFSRGRLKNKSVREIILMQCKKWYEKAIECKEGNDSEKRESRFYLGKLCHMVQDSYVLAHSWRRYTGDVGLDKIREAVEIPGMPIMTAADNGKIWTFQNYKAQDSNLHALADSQLQKKEGTSGRNIEFVNTIGYRSALESTSGIMKRYHLGLEWNEEREINGRKIKSPEFYLNHIYQICSGMGEKPSGECHPWFDESYTMKIYRVKKELSKISSRFIGEEDKYIREIERLNNPFLP